MVHLLDSGGGLGALLLANLDRKLFRKSLLGARPSRVPNTLVGTAVEGMVGIDRASSSNLEAGLSSDHAESKAKKPTSLSLVVSFTSSFESTTDTAGQGF